MDPPATKPDVGHGGNGVVVRAPVTRYPITAATLQEIRQQIRRDGPRFNGRSWDGATRWNLQWRYRFKASPALGCEIDEIQVEVLAQITMPQWLPETESDEPTKVWWRRYEAALMEHEAGHARRAVDAGRRIRRTLAGTRGTTCDILGRDVNARAQRILEEMRLAQLTYDEETRHGGIQIAAALNTETP